MSKKNVQLPPAYSGVFLLPGIGKFFGFFSHMTQQSSLPRLSRPTFVWLAKWHYYISRLYLETALLTFGVSFGGVLCRNNDNLSRLARIIRSPLIFAHVRAAYPGMPVSEQNCHPFQWGRYMWMHNGVVAGFSKVLFSNDRQS